MNYTVETRILRHERRYDIARVHLTGGAYIDLPLTTMHADRNVLSKTLNRLTVGTSLRVCASTDRFVVDGDIAFNAHPICCDGNTALLSAGGLFVHLVDFPQCLRQDETLRITLVIL